MLALLKKNGSTEKESGVPWRADFRNLESLPDTKTVRTTFLVNTLVFAILVGVILFCVIREITLSALKNDISSVEAQIATAQAPNKEAEAKFKEFQAEEKKLNDIRALGAGKFSFPDYLIHLASLMPAGVKCSRVEYRGFGQNILVIGSVDGQDATASETASKFIKILEEDAKLKDTFVSISNSNLGRNAATNSLSFELIFTFKKPNSVKK
jgi:hypothetical protein